MSKRLRSHRVEDDIADSLLLLDPDSYLGESPQISSAPTARTSSSSTTCDTTTEGLTRTSLSASGVLPTTTESRNELDSLWSGEFPPAGQENQVPEDRYLEQEMRDLKCQLTGESARILKALLTLSAKKWSAMWTKISLLQAQQESGKKVEGMCKFLYAWVKGAELAGVYKLPDRF